MTKILVVIDPREETHSALERCREMSSETDLQLHVCMFVEEASACELEPALREKAAWLDGQIKPYVNLGYNIVAEVISFDRLCEAIIRTVLKIDADFVFKPKRLSPLTHRLVLTSTDWNLIRFCPAPLLLVNDRKVVRGKPIVAAVDVCNHDANYEEMNHIVMGQSVRVARILESQVYGVNAWNVNAAVTAVGAVGRRPNELAHTEKIDHVTESLTFCRQYGVPDERIFVRKGTAGSVINSIARQIDAGVVVIGAVGTKGDERAFLRGHRQGAGAHPPLCPPARQRRVCQPWAVDSGQDLSRSRPPVRRPGHAAGADPARAQEAGRADGRGGTRRDQRRGGVEGRPSRHRRRRQQQGGGAVARHR